MSRLFPEIIIKCPKQGWLSEDDDCRGPTDEEQTAKYPAQEEEKLRTFPKNTVLSVFASSLGEAAAAAAAKSLQSCPTLCDPRDGSLPGSPIPGILQARILEWVDISFSNAWKWKVKLKSFSRVRPLATPWTAAHQASPFHGIFQARLLEWGAIAFSIIYDSYWLFNKVIFNELFFIRFSFHTVRSWMQNEPFGYLYVVLH